MRGGWVTSGPLNGRPFPVLDADIHSAYPAIWSLTAGWGHLCAERLRPVDVTTAFSKLLARDDLYQLMLDPATWRRWGLTRVRLRALGQPLPVNVVHGGDDAMLVVPTRAQSWDATWLDAVAAQLLGETPVDVISAVRLAPRGRQKGLSAVRTTQAGCSIPTTIPSLNWYICAPRPRRKVTCAMPPSFGSCATAWSMATLPGSIPWAAGPKSPGHGASLLLAAIMAAGFLRCLLAMVQAKVGA